MPRRILPLIIVWLAGADAGLVIMGAALVQHISPLAIAGAVILNACALIVSAAHVASANRAS